MDTDGFEAILLQQLREVVPQMSDADVATDWESYFRGQHDLIMVLLGMIGRGVGIAELLEGEPE